ncbi:thioredoxin [Pontibacter diazotrophicus]|uniref:Thioredoxin n=1 Tax=Pontibacter diazotrophicus TaxID=1400979 RepID=A0A3D8L0E3_9BACT|nr:thioredoxin family protein [Pontibacter diazotrophicus]RDV10687.1 thioredoxin [Pontibacter diazotrophicus]
MTIIECNDDHLRLLIFEKEKVIVKFIDPACEVCKQLAPSFTRFSSDPAYNDITFVRMNASENPVSSKEVRLTGTPFFATYRKGTLRDCGVVATEEEIKALLDSLK